MCVMLLLILLPPGHCELAKKTGAVIYYGPGAASRAEFDIHELKDDEVIIQFVGNCVL